MFKKATKSAQKLKLLLQGASGSGKAQPLDATILTPSGWKLMGDMRVGDEIINSQGGVSKVVGVFPQGEKEIYKVTFTDGACTECCSEHLWLTQSPSQRGHKKNGTVKSLNEIMEIGLKDNTNHFNHYIPMVKPVEFENSSNLPIDPYLLGVLLGDGCFQKKAILLSNPEIEIQNAVKSILPVGYELRPTIKGKTKDFGIRQVSRKSGSHYFLDAIRKLNLDEKKSYDKFIPTNYLFNSKEVRLAVLQGLLDTDGYTHGYTLEYSTSSQQLALDVKFLIQSFGGRVAIGEKIPTYTYKGEKKIGRKSYRLTIRLPASIKPFRLSRKEKSFIPKSKYEPARAISKIELVGKKEAQCISVDASDSLYITNDFIVTHNTFSSLILATEISKSTGKRIAFIDSENGSASLYADKFDFDVMELKDYSVHSYIKAMNEAMKSDDHSVVVIDSITQEWEWVLDQVSASTKGYPFNWKQPSDMHNQFLKTILMFNKHLICTTRAKQDYSLQENNGKKSVQKLGLAPIQREGIEYEFTTAFMIDANNKAEATKDRTALFKDKGMFKITDNTAKIFIDWLNNKPAQEQLEILQIAKETLESLNPEEYIEYINNDSVVKNISNAEILLELKKYSVEQASLKGYKLIDGKFTKQDDTDSTTN